MEQQILSAVEIAWNPSSDQNLRIQATEYCSQVRSDPSAWQPCLSIFTKTPRHGEVVRVFVLDVLQAVVQGGILDVASLNAIKDALLQDSRRLYLSNDISMPEPSSIQNKTAQLFSYLFVALYGTEWPTFFDDILALTSSGQNAAGGNASGTVFYLRTINSVHEEIGDQLVPRSRQQQDHANMLKDLIRDRDAYKIVGSWQNFLSLYRDTNDDIALLCLNAIGRWVGWIDISLVVNQQMLDVLFDQLSRAQKVELRVGEDSVRDAAIDVFTEIIGKKMKPQDKVQMIAFLNLENIISQLIACPPLSDKRFTSKYDTDLAETVAKLVNNTVLDVVKILDSEPQQSETWQRAENILHSLLPHLNRFFSDEYDEVCSTVIPCLTEVLAFLRKAAKVEGPSPQRAVMLLPILKAIFAKMRYDDTSSWGGEGEETDEAEFQYLRKRLSTLQQAVAAVDEQLYLDAVGGLVSQTFANLSTQSANLDWRELELALSEMLSFGDLAVRSGGLYLKNRPNSPAAERLVQMMKQMIDLEIQVFNHPACQLQYMEISVRYAPFFEKNSQLISQVLQSFLQFVHHPLKKVKYRSWYLFQRFVRQNRSRFGDIAESVISSLTELLPIKIENDDEEDRDDTLSEDNAQSENTAFSSQLFLFEAIGCICGAGSTPPSRQALYLQAVTNPIFSDMQRHLNLAGSGDTQSITQLHDCLMALATLARGFSDWTPGSRMAPSAADANGQAQAEFNRASEAILMVLKSLRTHAEIRSAARFSLSRLLAVLGPNMLPQLPDWIAGLLTDSTTNEEMTLFLRIMDQIIFSFKAEIAPFLDGLFATLVQGAFAGIALPSAGTDDAIQLAELKREYLNFLVTIMNNDLGSIIVSSVNQPIFENVIATIEHFARDEKDANTARMAFFALTKMCSVWGGPDIVTSTSTPAVSPSPQPSLPGFDQFMITRLSPLCWAIPMSPTFDPQDAQVRQALAEAAILQKTIYKKTGQEYLSWLREKELVNIGLNNEMISVYLSSLERLEQKAFKPFFQSFVTKGGAA